MSSAGEKLSQLRKLMDAKGVHAYIVPTADAHQSEYVPEFAMRRSFLSGFTGSAGTAVVFADDARLWTDGRYFLQAGEQLDSKHWTLMKDRLPETPSIGEFVRDYAAKKGLEEFRVGIDAQLHSAGECESWERTWKGKAIKLAPLDDNLVDKIWGEAQPAIPRAPIKVQPVKFAGTPVTDKLQSIRDELVKRNVAALAVTALDEVAWLFNIRGSDIDYNPVVMSYALVEREKATLYALSRNDTESDDAQALAAHLAEAKVGRKEYSAFFDDVKALLDGGERVWIDPASVSRAVEALAGGAASKFLRAESVIQRAKAIKCAAELQGARDCHVRDAAAVCQFLAWLEKQAAADALPTEIGASDWLDKARARQADFVSLSFDTISGSGPHGAVIHYKASAASDRPLARNEVYLCDSGGQYLDGTTDITRTVHHGEPSEHEIRCYTRVLQGHIDLGLAVFPKGTTGGALDILARLPLFADGLDYRHGTGHGVGAYLNVHEGPHGISFREGSRKHSLAPGMLVTDEPGYYEDGAFGIRIENVLEVVKANTKHSFGGTEFFTFEHVTLVPYSRKLTNISMLTDAQLNFVNEYHQRCLKEVGPLLAKQDSDALTWLEKNCEKWTR